MKSTMHGLKRASPSECGVGGGRSHLQGYGIWRRDNAQNFFRKSVHFVHVDARTSAVTATRYNQA